MKLFISALMLFSSMALASDVHKDLGENSTFFKLIEATKSEKLNRLIYAILENSSNLQLNGFVMAKAQPRCMGPIVIDVSFNDISNGKICKTAFLIGACGRFDVEQISGDDGDWRCSKK